MLSILKGKKTKIAFASVFLLIILINGILGFSRLSHFSAVDEEHWTYNRIPQYWNAIKNRQWKNTDINDKPGITVALVSGIGLFSINPIQYFPLIQNPKNNDQLKAIEKIYFAFRFPLYLFTLLMAPVFYLLLKKILNSTIALFSVIFIYLSPIILGISLFINPDSLLWIFIPLCLVSFLIFQRDDESFYAYLSGLFLGLAILTKYVSTILYVVLPFFFLFNYILSKNKSDPDYFKKKLIGYFKTILTSSLVVIAFYPAIWVKPEMFLETTFLSRPFQMIWPFFLGFVLLFSADTFLLKSQVTKLILDFFAKYKKIIIISIVALFVLGIIFVLINTYTEMKFVNFEKILADPKPRQHTISLKFFFTNISTGIYVLVFSLNPIILLFFSFFLYSIFANWIKNEEDEKFLPVFYLLVFILIYYCASAVNLVASTVRYQISLYPLAGIIAAFGLYQFINTLIPTRIKKHISVFSVSLIVIVFLSASLLLVRPHYFSYASVLFPKKYVLDGMGMGDGSYEAAQYLNSLPNAKNLVIWSDKTTVCETFAGKCLTTLKKHGLKDINFDYFVVSKGRTDKSISFARARKLRKLKQPIFGNISDLYSQENFSGKRISVGNQPNNFVKIIKNPYSKK